MENFIHIPYHRTRDFSAKMSVTFEFIRQNFKGLGKSILLIAGPPVLLASLLLSSFFQDMFTASFNAGRGGGEQMLQETFLSPSFWMQMALMMIFIMVSTVASIATVNNYILLYEEKQTNRLSVQEVWDRVRQTFMMYLGTAFMLTILAVAVYIGLIIFVALIGAGSGFAVLGMFVLFFVFIYLMVGTSFVFIIRAYERIGFFDALGRSFRLIQGKWWSTFGLVTVLYLLVVIMSYVFMIPWYALTVVSALHDAGVEGLGEAGQGSAVAVISSVLLTMYYLAQMLMYALPNVGIAFQYFNLVERKEARGLMDQIGSIGQPPSNTAPPDEHY